MSTTRVFVRKRFSLSIFWAGLAVALPCLFGLASAQALAEKEWVEGYWKMIDDKTNQPSSIVKVWVVGRELKAKVVKIFLKPGENPNPLCTKCVGARKNKPILGMTFVWGLKRTGKHSWGHGKILDPEEGKVYGCSLWAEKRGQELKVRGWVFIFFRTQTWLRTVSPFKEKKTSEPRAKR